MSCFPLWCTMNKFERLLDCNDSDDNAIMCNSFDEMTNIESQFSWFFSLPLVNNDFVDFIMKRGD